MRKFHASLALAPLAALLLGACGTGKVGELIRPKDLTAQDSLGLGPSCSGDPKLVRPLVVDLGPDDRVDLEAAMKKGVVVVAYDCRALRVLNNCALADGAYDYAGVSRKEHVVQLKSQDDVRANLPLSAGKFGGEVASGRALDLGLVYVGRKTTIVRGVERAELRGSCEGATHYLQSATVGAFSMATGSVGKAHAIGELFSIGGSASSESSRSTTSSDGSIDACRKSTPDDESPPAECRSPLRVELAPITSKPEPAQAAAAPAPPKPSDMKPGGDKPEENTCPSGYVLADGICTRDRAAAHLCASYDEAECKEQCERGDLGSCHNYGNLLSIKRTDSSEVPRDAIAVWQKACDGGHAESCYSWGSALRPFGDAPAAEARPRIAEAFEPLKRSCDLGSGWGCYNLAAVYDDDRNPPTRNPRAGFRALVRGCSLGLAFSCSSAARAYAEGKGVSKDVQKGLDYFAKACQGGSSEVCGDFADELVKGEAFPKDLRRASEIATKLCESPDAKAQARAFSYCDKAAEIYLELGRPDKALPFAKKACESSKPMGCFTLAQMQESGKGTPKNAAAANAIYQEGCDEILYKTADDLRYHPACPAYFETKQDSAPAAKPKPKSKPKGKGGARRRT